mmetsp:Transcript_3132/g.5289  ORF Transcript_3132/g.5289 Transcript_3132/m.5289 type:complete len:94 (+) Transcript_3132:2034-2315(+)
MRHTIRLPAILSQYCRRPTPTPAVNVRANSPSAACAGLVAGAAADASMAPSRTVPHAYGNNNVMDEVTANVAADPMMSFLSGFDISYSLFIIS